MERGWETVVRPWGREEYQHSGRVWVRGWSLAVSMRLETIIVFMYRVGYSILEEWMGSEVHMVGEVVIATVQWWASVATRKPVECVALHMSRC